MAKNTNYTTTGIIETHETVLTRNQHRQQALEQHAKMKRDFDNAAAGLGIPLEEDERINYDAVKPIEAQGEQPDELNRSAEELRHHDEDNPNETAETKNTAIANADAAKEKVKSSSKDAADKEEADKKHKAVAHAHAHSSHKKADK